MRKKIKFKSLLLDIFMTAACLSIAGYFVYSFWKDLNTSAKRTDKEKIAIITFKNRIAQRKFDDRVVWERIDKATPLYNGDLVRTADLAEAVITFNDNSTIDLYENSMIQVYYSENEGIKISVDNGNLQVDSSINSKVALSLDNGSVINAGGGTSLATQSSKNGIHSVDVKNGAATITSEKGESEALSAGQSASMQKSGEIKKNDLTVTSIPQEMSLLSLDGKEVAVTIEWQKADKNRPVVIETSYKKDFSVIEETKKVEDLNSSILNVKSGVLYWRLYPEGNKDEVTEGKIKVEATEPIKLLSPVDGGCFRYRNSNPKISFRWSQCDYAKSYMFIVASSPDMHSPLIAKEVTETSITLDSIGAGDWWWQITPYFEKNSIGYTGESSQGKFSVVKNDVINPPSLTIPLDNSIITSKESAKVNFGWKSELSASYEVYVSDSPDFSNLIYKTQTSAKHTSTNLEVPESEEKTYYWKVVRKSNETEDITPVSDVHSFTLARYKDEPNRLLYPPEEYSTEASKLSSLQFMWKPAPQNISLNSVIQFSSSRDFSSIHKEKVLQKTVFGDLSLSEGSWWWRIASVKEDGTYTDYTEGRHLQVLKELEAPELLGIKNNQEILLAADMPLTLAWNKVAGADYYNVRIFDSNNQIVAENSSVENTSVKFSLNDAAYSIKLQAVSAKSEYSPLRTGPVTSLAFSVRRPSPVNTLSPANGTKIEGLTAIRNPLVFTWKNGIDKPALSDFVLKKRQSDGSMRIVETRRVTKNTISLSRLTPGFYTWQINASTSEGLPINSQVKSFTITSVESLEKPIPQNPQNSFVMNSDYLRKNRSITFEWKPVDEATEYNFILYKKERNGKLTPVYSENNIKTTKLRFKNLSMLDVGNFVWNVTAFSYAKDGFEERRSQSASAEFKIDISVPVQIKADSPGRMYSEE